MAKYVEMNYYNGSEYEVIYPDYVYNSTQIGFGQGIGEGQYGVCKAVLPCTFQHIKQLVISTSFMSNPGNFYFSVYKNGSSGWTKSVLISLPNASSISSTNQFNLIIYLLNRYETSNMRIMIIGRMTQNTSTTYINYFNIWDIADSFGFFQNNNLTGPLSLDINSTICDFSTDAND